MGDLNELTMYELVDELGLSRKELPELCDVSVHTVNKWFSGGKIPDKHRENLILKARLKESESRVAENDPVEAMRALLKEIERNDPIRRLEDFTDGELLSELEKRFDGCKVQVVKIIRC